MAFACAHVNEAAKCELTSWKILWPGMVKARVTGSGDSPHWGQWFALKSWSRVRRNSTNSIIFLRKEMSENSLRESPRNRKLRAAAALLLNLCTSPCWAKSRHSGKRVSRLQAVCPARQMTGTGISETEGRNLVWKEPKNIIQQPL